MISANSNRKYVERLVSKVDWNHFISQTLLVSPDNKRVAFVDTKKDRTVVIDGKRQEFNIKRDKSIIFSPDSTHLAYVADKDYRKQFVVVDGVRGKETDRVKRRNTYVKDFKSLKTGVKHLEKGTGELTLKATDIPGSMVMDMRLVMLTRVE